MRSFASGTNALTDQEAEVLGTELIDVLAPEFVAPAHQWRGIVGRLILRTPLEVLHARHPVAMAHARGCVDGGSTCPGTPDMRVIGLAVVAGRHFWDTDGDE